MIAKKKEFSSKELLSIVLGQILKEKESMKQIGLPTSFLNLRTNYELIKKFNFKINGQHLENITKVIFFLNIYISKVNSLRE